jgi:hypothetical protein
MGPQGPQGATGPMGPQGPAGTADVSALFGTTAFDSDGSSGAECTIGDVTLTASNRGNGLVADGRSLPIQAYQVLYTLLGTRYGGDGVTSFALPDLRDVAPKSRNGQRLNFVVCVDGLYPSYD